MQPQIQNNIALTLLALLSSINAQLSTAHAQGTAFTYQGRLDSGGAPANGSYDLKLTLFGAVTNGNAIAGPVTNAAVAASNGLFTTTIDFGSGVWNGETNWLQIGVETNGAGSFTTLTPRQQLTPAPYAIFAEGANAAGLTGTLPMASLSGTYGAAVSLTNAGNSFFGNGSGLTGVNATTLNGFGANSFWQISGNAGTTAGLNFLGTMDNQPLELRVDGLRALRLEPTPGTNAAPNVIGGSPFNAVANGVYGATIGGGGQVGFSNSVTADFGTVGGGGGNIASGWASTVGGGAENTASSPDGSAEVGGGDHNTASGDSSTVGGGFINSAIGVYSTVGGGVANICYSDYSTVAGGNANVIGTSANGAGTNGFVGGGIRNYVTGNGATVVGGVLNFATGDDSVVAGGTGNYTSYEGSAIGGGENNLSSEFYATVSGGLGNTASGLGATVCGGGGNTAGGFYATVAGGDGNAANGAFSFAAGTDANAANNGSFVWSDESGGYFSSTADNQFCVRAAGGILLAGDVQLSGGAAYHNLSLGGGNAVGYLYGSYPALGDGIHLGYNWYYDANGDAHISNNGGATSRLTVGYGFVGIYVGGVLAPPTTQRLLANSTGVTVNGTFNNSSDRNAKQDFAPVNPSEILEKVTRLPLSEWSYKEDPKTRHVGPMGQDFYATFNIGTDEKHIAPIDEGGVALAAIQGLNQKLSEELKRRDAENAELKQRLDALEKILLKQKPN